MYTNVHNSFIHKVKVKVKKNKEKNKIEKKIIKKKESCGTYTLWNITQLLKRMHLNQF